MNNSKPPADTASTSNDNSIPPVDTVSTSNTNIVTAKKKPGRKRNTPQQNAEYALSNILITIPSQTFDYRSAKRRKMKEAERQAARYQQKKYAAQRLHSETVARRKQAKELEATAAESSSVEFNAADENLPPAPINTCAPAENYGEYLRESFDADCELDNDGVPLGAARFVLITLTD